MNNEETFYRAMRRQGVTRRSFLKYCSLAATSLGLGAGMAPKIAGRWRTNPHSGGMDPRSGMHLLYRIFYPLRSPTGEGRHPFPDFPRLRRYFDGCRRNPGEEEVFEDIITQYNGKYILAVEGNPPLGEQGMFCISSGRPFIEKLKRAAAGASAIIARGTCASWGCVQAARPNPTQATPIDKVITDKPIIKVPAARRSRM